MDAPRAQRFRSLEAEQGIHLAQGVGDGRAGGLDERAAGIPFVDEPGFYEQVPCPLRSVRIDALQVDPIGRKAQLAKLLGFIDDQLIDTDLLVMR
jgi:hypothetical protein